VVEMDSGEMKTVSFRAMGSPCRIVVRGGDDSLADQATTLVRELERDWSRFLGGSGVSLMNHHAGQLTIVPPVVYDLVEHATTAQTLTNGRFNPLMLKQLEHLGYRRPWQDGGAQIPGIAPDPASLQPIDTLAEISAVRIPAGTAFDPGGIGKGLAADRATDFLIAHGATTTSVELGGDLRVSGDCWYGPEWRIGVTHPLNSGTHVATFTPDEGAVATSSILKRNWSDGPRRLHHLLDPTTGTSAETDLVSVSACATNTWWAEVAAKSALIAGSALALELLSEFNTPGVAVTTEGKVLMTPNTTLHRSQEALTA
jgi:FAD:protein FMN transferase